MLRLEAIWEMGFSSESFRHCPKVKSQASSWRLSVCMRLHLLNKYMWVAYQKCMEPNLISALLQTRQSASSLHLRTFLPRISAVCTNHVLVCTGW
jgi:hypothetical protein